MDLQQIIAQTGGLEAIAGQLGIGQQQAASGLEALLPAVLGGFKKNAQEQQGGLGSLMDAVQGLGGTGLVDNVMGPQPTDTDTGNNILGQIFGSKDVSRAVAAHASAQSGVDSSILQKMLPIVAMLAAGYMARGASAQSGGLGGLLGGMLGGGGNTGSGGGLGGLLGGLFGGGQTAGSPAGLGGIGAMLDMDGDGNPLNDILSKLTGR